MDELPEMRVVAAVFPETAQAEAAEADLRSQLDVGRADTARAPLGGEPAKHGLPALLGGHVRLHRAELVETIEDAEDEHALVPRR